MRYHPKQKSKLGRQCGLIGIVLMLCASALMAWNCADLQRKISNAEAYSRANKISVTTMTLAQIADGVTTDRGIKAGAKEMNALLGEKPSTDSIALFTLTAITFKWLLGHIMPAKWRNWFWGTATVIHAGAAINNNNVYQDME